MSPPTSPQPKPSAETFNPVRPSVRYSMTGVYTTVRARPACRPQTRRLLSGSYAPYAPRPHRPLRLASLPGHHDLRPAVRRGGVPRHLGSRGGGRSEEHTSELQSRPYLVCRLLLEKKTPLASSSSMPPATRAHTVWPTP